MEINNFKITKKVEELITHFQITLPNHQKHKKVQYMIHTPINNFKVISRAKEINNFNDQLPTSPMHLKIRPKISNLYNK